MELAKRIMPTERGELKTDAINLSQPFLWFDDDLTTEERAAFAAHNVLDGWIGVDLASNPNQLREFIALLQQT